MPTILHALEHMATELWTADKRITNLSTERVGFEPTESLRIHLISSQAHSTTLPPLQAHF